MRSHLFRLAVLAATLAVIGATAGPAIAQDNADTDILNNNSTFRWRVIEPGDEPADWQDVGVDDSRWPRSRLGWLRELASMSGSASGLVVRGKFDVTDPGAVRSLSLTCEHGNPVGAWLNGKPVAPGGKLNGTRLATAGLLRRGVNVLAVRFDRDRTARPRPGAPPDNHVAWPDAGGIELHLRATGRGITPNVKRPKGLQVWNHDRNDRVTSRDWGDPNEPLGPVSIVAARNGAFAGQVVLSSTEPVRGLKVAAGDLAGPAGATIPAGRVTLLFGKMDWRSYHYPDWCDALRSRAPTEVPVEMIRIWNAPDIPDAAMLPIVIRVQVPRDAAPGDYVGRVTIRADGVSPVVVPVQLHVSPWTLPDPKDFATYIGIYQSPTSVALQYGVQQWSEAHWKLLEKSYELLGRVGNDLALVHVVEQTQFGNDEGMIRWIRRPDGSFDYDFSVLDRYLELVKRHMGKPEFVACQVWHSGGWETRKATNQCTVTVIDKATGRRSESLQVPVFGTEESKRFFKPVLDGIRARLARLGWQDSMILGILSDGTAPTPVFTAFNEIIPGGAKWMRGCHRQEYSPKPYGIKGGGKVVLHEYCYGLGYADPSKPLPPFHTYRRNGRPGAAYHRIAGHESAATLIWYRTFPEQALYRNTRGVGRICLDFWPVIKGQRHNTWIYNRYPHSSCAQREPSLQKMTWPGPDGAATTVRFEAFVEGVQEAEAVLLLRSAMDRLAESDPALAKRCHDLLIDRLNYCRHRDQQRWAHCYFHMNHYGWQELSRRLFDLAAEVAPKLPNDEARMTNQ